MLEVEHIDFHDRARSVPVFITSDPIWSLEAYRLATYVADISWADVTFLAEDRRTRSLADQLYRSLGSIGANVAEGYSRGTGRDRARFYEYGLGSAREARDWYLKARHSLGEKVAHQRMVILTQVIKLLSRMCGDQRGYRVHEGEEGYNSESNFLTSDHESRITHHKP
jgi:four helix bundle protein